MSVDLSDPNITSVYDEIIKYQGKDWLLLSYLGTRDKLSLVDSGEGNFEDLCQCVRHSPADVYFGFCRERDGKKNYFALIAFVPTTVAGVRRARALVHSRAVGSLFKAANVSINVSDLDSVDMDTLRERLRLPASLIPRLAAKANHLVQRSASMPAESSVLPMGLPHNPAAMRAVSSEHQGGSSTLSMDSPAHMARMPSIIDADELPPPTPPKDPQQAKSTSGFAHSRPMSPSYSSPPAPGYGRRKEVSVISQSPPRAPRSPPRILSPEERAHLRYEAQQRKKAEELREQEEEAHRQTMLKQRKEENQRRELEEEELRLAKIEEDKRRALMERTRREREREMEEEQKAREAEMRKEQEKARRLEQTRRLEEERQTLERQTAEMARKSEEQRQLAESRKRQRMREIQERFSNSRIRATDAVLLTGTVTVQTSLSLSWKRRFFELTEDAVLFYRDSLERTSPLDIMSLTGKRVAAVKEPYDGYEELEAIPHAFAVEFKDEEGAWSMFSDHEEDKDVFVSLLSQICGL